MLACRSGECAIAAEAFMNDGGRGKVHQVFGSELNKIIEELNGVLAA